MSEEQEESSKRELGKIFGIIVSIICIGMSLFHFYTAGFGVLTAYLQRNVHMLFALPITMLLFKPSRKKWAENKIFFAMDIALSIIGAAAITYFITNYELIARRQGAPTEWDIVAGAIVLLITIEMGRRSTGLILPLMVICFLIYAYLGPYFPGWFGHRGFDWERIISYQTLTTEGLFGVPLGVTATYVYIFILFGSFLQASKADKFFVDLALAATGHRPGGPAQTAVFASAFIGTVQGASSANVVTTGSVTIPMMIGMGYKRVFAGAVEAAASTGGQIMPPVMGAAAFIMAEYTGIPYVQIMKAAALPAILYFLAILFQVRSRAIKDGLRGVPKDQLPSLRKVLADGFYLFVPLIILLYLLIGKGFSPLGAGFWCVVSTILVTMFKKVTRMNIKSFLWALDKTARTACDVSSACALAGVTIGVLGLTGLGLKLSGLVLDIAGGRLWAALFLTMVVSLILGMGLPTSAAYIVLAVLVAPALVQMGVSVMAAHMFIFYFGCISSITPPVALAAYAAAALCKDNPMKVGWQATKLGIAAFIVPYMFVYGPSLLLEGSSMELIWTVITSVIGVAALAGGVEGWFFGQTKMWERILLIAGSLNLILPGLITDGIGFFLVGIVFINHKYLK